MEGRRGEERRRGVEDDRQVERRGELDRGRVGWRGEEMGGEEDIWGRGGERGEEKLGSRGGQSRRGGMQFINLTNLLSHLSPGKSVDSEGV